MSTTQMSASSAVTRRELVQSKLLGILSRLFGRGPEEIPIGASLMELGADSLFLLQMSQVLRDEFHIKVPFRLLLDELSTVQALADHLDQHLPESFARDSKSKPASIPQTEQPEIALPSGGETQIRAEENRTGQLKASAESSSATRAQFNSAHDISASPIGDSRIVQPGSLDQIIEQQLKIGQEQLRMMTLQLELLRAQDPAIQLTAPAKVSADDDLQNRERSSTAGGLSNAEIQVEPAPFVPHEPLMRGAGGGLTERQHSHLNGLIARINARTPGSKRLTQHYRSCLANNRATAAYRQLWKEMVYPLIVERGKGSHIWDVDGNEYIDLTMGFGALLFGHSPDFIVDAIQRQLNKGLQLGAHTALAGEAANLIRELTGVERVAFCNSGTEAIMGALRLARAVTGKTKIALFEGCYHGTFDGIMVRGKTDASNCLHAVPMAPGVPPKMIEDVLLLKYGVEESLEILQKHIHELAAVLIEPPRSRRPDIRPQEFLRGLRRLTEKAGVALIFDEVVTGFRFHPGGAQAMFGVQADLVTYGKAVGGGVPVAVIAGKAAYMDAVDGGMWNYGDSSFPAGDITFLTGTYFQHPVTMAALVAVLNHIREEGLQLQERLAERTSHITEALKGYFDQRRVALRVAYMGSLFRLLHGPELKCMDLFYYHLLEKGVFVCETRNCLLSTAHSDEDAESIIRAFKETTDEMIDGDFLPQFAARPLTGGMASSELATPAYSLVGCKSPVASSAQVCGGKPPIQLPLTDGQKQIWALASMDPEGGRAYNQSIALRLQGNLDHASLTSALQRIVDRHEALRVSISPTGDYQQIARALEIQVPLMNLENCEAIERETKLHELLRAESRRLFDLSQPPLFRLKLIKAAINDYFLVITAHHVVFDGWSMGVVVRELRDLYAATRSGRDAMLPAADSYTEYVQALVSNENRDLQIAETYWLTQLRGTLPALNLQSDRPRSGLQSYVGAQDRIVLEPALYPQVKLLSTSQGCTTFMTLLAVFKVLLHHLTGQEDIIVGSPSAGQLLAEKPNLVGYCVNLLPLRSRVTSVMSFAQYLKALKQIVLQAHEQQAYPYTRLLKKLNLPRRSGRSPLVEAVFNLDYGQTTAKFFDLQAEIVANHSGSSKFDVTFDVTDHRTHFTLDCEYNTGLFDASRAHTWMRQCEAILGLVAATPEMKISQIRAHLRELDKEQDACGGGRVHARPGTDFQFGRRASVQTA